MGAIVIIWSIVCIILFFKVWRACNDIHTLKEKINDTRTIEELYLVGDDEHVYTALNKSLAKRITVIVNNMVKTYGGTVEWSEKRLNNRFKKVLDALLEEYSPKYKIIGKSIPERIANAKFSDLYLQKMLILQSETCK